MYPELQPELQKTFEKTNDLLRYIKPNQGDETYRVSTMPEAAAQELLELLDDALETSFFWDFEDLVVEGDGGDVGDLLEDEFGCFELNSDDSEVGVGEAEVFLSVLK